MSVKTILALGILSTFSAGAAAHSLFLNCEQEDLQIHCMGSFSDGSVANNLPIEVISYDDETLQKGETDDAAKYSFAVPSKEYYILLDAGPGHVVEVDMLDVTH